VAPDRGHDRPGPGHAGPGGGPLQGAYCLKIRQLDLVELNIFLVYDLPKKNPFGRFWDA
jgi:hypothetical protein